MGSRRALVVGIDQYAGVGAPDLTCCVNDADSVATMLEFEEYDFDVVRLLDGEATTAAIYRTLLNIRAHAPEVMLFYFSGHGMTTELGSFLVTADAREFAEGVEIAKLADALMPALGTGASVAILDCCHAGVVELGPRLGGVLTPLEASAIEQAFGNVLNVSRAVLAACRSDELSWEGPNGLSAFTEVLIDGLGGGAADYQGTVSVHSLYDYVSRPMVSHLNQTPVFRGDVYGRLVLAAGLPPQLGPPLEEDALAEMEEKAEHMLDAYAAATVGSLTNWRQGGHLAASQALGPIFTWFEEKLGATPALLRRERFRNLHKALLTRVEQLGSIDPGTTVSEGVVDAELGRGSFGTVYSVCDASGMRKLAYKVFHPTELTDVQKLKRFRRGYDAMAQLNHPRVVRVHGWTTCPVGFYMDYVDGTNVRGLQPAESLTPQEVIRLLIEAAETIDHSHGRGVIHRDIKPENVVCRWHDDRWQPYLTDFDLAWFSTLTQVTHEAIGSIHYAAPEQFVNYRPRDAERRAPTLDVFSFGQLMFFCVMGFDPHPIGIDKNIEALRKNASGWPTGQAVSDLIELYADLTRWEPEDRPQAMGEVIERLRRLELETVPESLPTYLRPGRFKAELVFAFTGSPAGGLWSEEMSFVTTSGQTQVTLTSDEAEEGWESDEARQFKLSAQVHPQETYHLENVPNARMRQILNSRVDKALEGVRGASRSPGRRGSFEVFVNFNGLRPQWEDLERVRAALSEVIRAVEAR